MWKRMLGLFLASRVLRLLSGRRRMSNPGAFRHAYPRRWNHHSHGMHELAEMMGLHRRRRSFI